MEKRKVILAAAVAGLVAAGSMAKISVVQAEEPAAKAEGKDGCGGKNGCGAKMEKTSAEKTAKHEMKAKKHGKKHAEKAEKTEGKKAE